MRAKYDVVIIGAGAAGLATAERLYNNGVTNIIVFSEGQEYSASKNSGSDKQTYYKLDIASPSGDSVQKMAEDYFKSGSMNGTDAYLEAANSLPCFMHLVDLGVPFPKDEYGVYQGYRTDHDNTKRATSAGPLTSKYMTEVLERSVRAKGIEICENVQVIKLLVSDNKCNGCVLLAGNKTETIYSKATVICTGAPSGIYYDSVYPVGHCGATGLAIEAGVALQNFQEWQYGIASKKFRWNLSGSYQQVIPRYVSVDDNGNEIEFLSEDAENLNRIFLKGYEWPFDSRKTSGSSLIDILVLQEISKGKRVYLDYTKNPSGFDFALLSDEAGEYLKKADVNADTPYKRLMQLNPKAVKLYMSHDIDLSKEYLEIGVCAQHNNGGIKVDFNGQTAVKGLFAAGEASGRFGVYRPGGAALNDTQVGALLISAYIPSFIASREFCTAGDDIKLPAISDYSNINEIDKKFGRLMSQYAGNVRDFDELEKIKKKLQELLENFDGIVKIGSESEYGKYYRLYYNTVARLALCNTEIASIERIGSRGGCTCYKNGKVVDESSDSRTLVTETLNGTVTFTEVQPIPKYECVFEKLLK